jgi:predicted dehydrogenase
LSYFEDLDDILDCAGKKNRVVHEAIMTQHHTWPESLHTFIAENRYGKLLSVESYFYSNLEKNPANYRFKKTMGGGCFYDFSPYWIHFLQQTLGLVPSEIKVNPEFDADLNIDASVYVELGYDGARAKFHASFNKPLKLRIRLFLRMPG